MYSEAQDPLHATVLRTAQQNDCLENEVGAPQEVPGRWLLS